MYVIHNGYDNIYNIYTDMIILIFLMIGSFLSGVILAGFWFYMSEQGHIYDIGYNNGYQKGYKQAETDVLRRV